MCQINWESERINFQSFFLVFNNWNYTFLDMCFLRDLFQRHKMVNYVYFHKIYHNV